MTLPTISTMPSQAALSVMIVDDESPARARLRDLLSDVAAEVPNAVVAEAANGLLAIEAIALHPVDVVLADIRMPKMDGIELARHVGRMERPPAIIFVTAYESYAVQAFELNAIDYLVKPVRPEALAEALIARGWRIVLASDERLTEASTAALAIVAVGLLPLIALSRQISRARKST